MARSRRPDSLVLPGVAGSEDLVNAIVDRIADGVLVDGDTIPSTRTLAQQTGLSRGAVVRAFDELAAAGFVSAEQGSGTTVSGGAAQAARAGARTRGSGASEARSVVQPRRGRSRRDLRPGVPDATLVDDRAWRRAVRAAGSEGLSGLNPWDEPSPALRAALAVHLRRHRGLSAAEPLLFDSSRSSIAALLSAFATSRSDGRQPPQIPFHIEDPGYRGALLMAREQGLDVRFHPADPDGMNAARLGDEPAIVFITPAHQYPLGHRMSVDRRVALVEWARRTGSLVVEDDYDGEFRYGVAPLPALATLPGGREHVAYVGTSSKSVSPDLRVAWCLPPADLIPGVQWWLAVHRRGPSALPADALAEFITSGAMDRHLARAARVYSDRRSTLVAALADACPDLAVTGVEAGLHLCVLLTDHDDESVVAALDTAGWRTRSLSSQSAERRVSGLVLNYSRLTRQDAVEFAHTLGEMLVPHRPRKPPSMPPTPAS